MLWSINSTFNQTIKYVNIRLIISYFNQLNMVFYFDITPCLIKFIFINHLIDHPLSIFKLHLFISTFIFLQFLANPFLNDPNILFGQFICYLQPNISILRFSPAFDTFDQCYKLLLDILSKQFIQLLLYQISIR